MTCSLHKLSIFLLAGVALYFVDGIPVSQFSSTSYTSDSNGSHTVVVDGDDSGTRVGVGSGPPAQTSDSNSNFIMSRFGSPAVTPRPNQVFYIPAGQSQTISTGNTVIQTRMGSGSTGTGSSSQVAQVSSSNDGSSHSVSAGSFSSNQHGSSSSNDDDNYNNDGFDN